MSLVRRSLMVVGAVVLVSVSGASTQSLVAQATPKHGVGSKHYPAAKPAVPPVPRSLDILLTNDDGYSTPAIQNLRAALIAAGHHVITVAPDANKSGSGASLTLGAVPVTEVEPDVYAVSGSPATTVLLGASTYFAPGELDLVISGPNEGANIGPAAPISGTVGAAIASISPLGPGVPAIAISTDLLTTDPADPINLAHYSDVSEFMVRLVRRLDLSSHGQAVLPAGLALNVNYPALAAADVQGVKLSVQGRATAFKIQYSEVAPGVFAPAIQGAEAGDDVEGSDVTAYSAGYISIVPIDGDYTADWSAFGPLYGRLNRLAP